VFGCRKRILHATYTAFILSKLVLGSKSVLPSVLMAARGDGKRICAFLQAIIYILGLKSKLMVFIFSQLHITMEPE
jgi:hypothetical protein